MSKKNMSTKSREPVKRTLKPEDFDDMDAFAEQRAHIGLESDDELSSYDQDSGEEAIMNVPDEQDFEDSADDLEPEEEHKKPSKKDKLAALRSKNAEKTRKESKRIQQLAQTANNSDDDILNDRLHREASEDEDNAASVWGQSRRNYYAEDAEIEGAEAVAQVAQEARRLQKKRLSALRVDDFLAPEANVTKTKTSGRKTKVVFDDLSEFLDEEKPAASETESEALDEEETAELMALLKDFSGRLTILRTQLVPLIDAAKSKKAPSSAGLSFLQCKYHMMLAYCSAVAYYLLLKSRGVRVAGHPVFRRLIRYRLMLEKLRPLEQKLRPQIEKLLHEGSESTGPAFKPNPSAMVVDEPLDSDASDADDRKDVYRAPKLAPTYYRDDEFETGGKKGTRAEVVSEERLRKAAGRSRLLAELRGEVDDLPEEESIDPVRMSSREKTDKNAINIEKYEEDNFMRFQTSKKEQRRMEKQAKPLDELDDLDEFFGELDEINNTAGFSKHASSKKRSAASIGDYLASINQDDAKDTKNSRPTKYMGSDESDIEDDIKTTRQDKKRVRRQERLAVKQAQRGPVSHRPIQDHDASEPRPASYEMLKNRGLTPSRSKEQRNPRVKQRNRYERAVKKLSSSRGGKLTTNTSKPYVGESTGIKTNLTKSVRFKH